MWRVCTKDTEIGGMTVPAGSMLQLRCSSADRDDAVFEAAETFDVGRRNASQNVAFGHGVHMCIGASLARKEMSVAFRVILDEMQDFALDCPEHELDYQPNVLLRGLRTPPIRFARRQR